MLSAKRRIYNLVTVEEIRHHPNGVRIYELEKGLRIPKFFLALILHDLQRQGLVDVSHTGLYLLTDKGRQYISELQKDIKLQMDSLIRFLILCTEYQLKRPIRNKRIVGELEKYFLERIAEMARKNSDEGTENLASHLLLKLVGLKTSTSPENDNKKWTLSDDTAKEGSAYHRRQG